MLIARGHKCPATEYVQIRNVVSPAERIQHAALRIFPHSAAADFVNQPARRTHAGLRFGDLSARGEEKLARAIEKIRIHLLIVVTVRAVNLQDGNAPFVFDLGIDLDKVVFARQHLSSR